MLTPTRFAFPRATLGGGSTLTFGLTAGYAIVTPVRNGITPYAQPNNQQVQLAAVQLFTQLHRCVDKDQLLMSEFNQNIRELQKLNLSIRQQLELAEARVPELNDLISQFARLDLANGTSVLGEIIYRRGYAFGRGPIDSGQLAQAAIVVPGGVGVVLWDLTDYIDTQHSPEELEAAVFPRFLPFNECNAGLKGLLLPHIEELSKRLLTVIKPNAE